MGKTRLEAFSDGVLAIVITIMVLELKVPHSTRWEDLGQLLPVFSNYLPADPAMQALIDRHPEWGPARACTAAGVQAVYCRERRDHVLCAPALREIAEHRGLGLARNPDFVVFDVLRRIADLPALQQFHHRAAGPRLVQHGAGHQLQYLGQGHVQR